MTNALDHILDGRYLEWPQDWGALFGRNAPLMVEIGFGRGDFLVHLAETHPDANLIGVEVSQPSLRKAVAKRRARGLTNLLVVYGSAPDLLWRSTAPGTLRDVYINFPDPWPKEGHHSRRLITPAFIDLLATRMQPGARLSIATDHPDYQPVVTACLEATPHFDSRLPTTFITDDPHRLRTKYELKAVAEGRTCHYYKFVRNQASAPDAFPLPQEIPMPHAIVRSSLSLDQFAEAFEPSVCADAEVGIHVRLMHVYRMADAPVLLIEAHINQEPQPQRVALKLREREPGEYMLSLHELGFPRPTLGVHRAVGCALGWLHAADAQLETVHSTLRQ